MIVGKIRDERVKVNLSKRLGAITLLLNPWINNSCPLAGELLVNCGVKLVNYGLKSGLQDMDC